MRFKKIAGLSALLLSAFGAKAALAQDTGRQQIFDEFNILRRNGLDAQAVRDMTGGSMPVTLVIDGSVPEGQALGGREEDGSCKVRMSSSGDDFSQILRLNKLDAVPVTHPAPAGAFEKITLLHELHHCGQRFLSEEGSDQAALSWYLNHGGDRDAARAWIYERALDTLFRDWKINEGAESYYDIFDGHKGLAFILQARFFDGPYIEQEDSQRAFYRAAELMETFTRTHRGQYGLRDSGNPAKARKIIESILSEPVPAGLDGAEMKKILVARQALELCDRAYRFFAGEEERQQFVSPPAPRPSV